MGVKSFIKKSASFMSAMAMACSMVVMPAGSSYAATDSTTTSTNGLELSKKIELQEDGNYKITLEAYSTGEDTTVPIEKPVPLDIVLVLDQSGSMDSKITSYKYIAQDSKSYSYNSYGNSSYYYKDGEQYYQVKIGKDDGWFGSSTYYLYYTKDGTRYYLNDSSTTTNRPNITSPIQTIWTGVLYTRQQSTTTRLEALKTAVTNFVSTVKDKASDEVKHRIAMVGFATGTENKYNSKYENTELLIGSKKCTYGKISEDDYKKAFQDITTQAGQNNITSSIGALTADGATRADLGIEIANNVFLNNPIQESENRKRVVVMFTDGEPNDYSGFDDNVATNTINNAKESKGTHGASVFTVGILDGASPSGSIVGTSNTAKINRYMHYTSSNFPNASGLGIPGTGGEAKSDGYYKVATDAEGLNDVFQTISDSVTTPSTTVTLTGKSILRDVISGNFTLPEGKTKNQIVSVYTDTSKTVDNDGTVTWSENPQPYDMKNVTIDGKKVDVTGFDYSNEYVTKSHSGRKLIVEILVNGLKSGKDMDSNDTSDAKTGIYASSSETTPQVPIKSPTVDIPEYSYVLDYGKKVVLPNVDKNTKNVYDSNQSKNYSSTTIMNSALAAPSADKTVKGNYGTFNLDSDNQLTYQPGKINWKGYDSIFTFGTRASDSKYEWYKTNVIPATSVYYEDDFASTETVPEGEEESNIRIVYGGSWNVISSTGNNSQSSENTVYGWEESYKNDTNFSDGSVHYTDNINATATFTFTGTGVDVYSKTDGDVGMIRAQIYRDGSSKAMKTLYIDNISVSGTYYQIPTLSFDGLDYSTYKVVINAGGKGTGGGTTYYLDGIRVYNPLGVTDKEIGTTAKDAYENAGEYNATSKEVRDLLLDVKSFNVENKAQGIVFIDKFDKTVGATSNDIKTFEDYGPKNEVYLKSGQSIAFEIQSGYENLFIGAKSPTGNEITMTVSDKNEKGAKDIVFSHASDMYYKIDPPASTTNGKNVVVITNNGSSLLSLTKIRATGEGYNMNIGYTPALMSYVSEFSLLDPAETNEKGMVVETPDTDVDIDNPSEEEDKDNNQDNAQQDNQNSVGGFWNKVLNGFKNWFKK